MWTKDEQEAPSAPAAHTSPPAKKQTRIGASVALKGTLRAEEDLFLEGRLDGEITVPGHQVTVGRDGQVKANVSARVVEVEGRVRGDLNGTERVVVAATGNVEGNIKAPRVSLENGAQFKGSIDMDPASGSSQSAPPQARKGPKPAVAEAASQQTEASAASS